jgi:hypothetical protein
MRTGFPAGPAAWKGGRGDDWPPRNEKISGVLLVTETLTWDWVLCEKGGLIDYAETTLAARIFPGYCGPS